MSLFSTTAQVPAQMSREDARHLIEKIAVGHGYVAEETLAAMPPDVRRIVEEALKKDAKSIPLVSELVQSLATGYNNVAYELLQNADDNQYTRIKSTGGAPGISFVVSQDMILIESNEDGFTESDVKALCDVNKTSKGDLQGYLGQPGMGFKSVFTIASKVQIESGPFSFQFRYEDGDSGIGMIRPHWTAPVALPDYLQGHEPFDFTPDRTRIILYFKNENKANLRENFVSQLWDTPDTVLLFMRNLCEFKITVLDKDNKPHRSKNVGLQKDLFGSGVRLQMTKRIGVTQLKTWNRYHVYKSTAENLAANPNRRPGPNGQTTASNAEIVLAFPVDDKSDPIIETQRLFAFMPLQEAHFGFLIHSDFVTDAGRQNIVRTSERNIGLRTAVLEALMRAVEDLCRKPVLDHKWVRYLPRQNQLSSDPFWAEFDALLRSRLLQTPILRPKTPTSGLYKMQLLNRLPDELLDKEGLPLVPDLPTQRYLSQGYETQDLDILTEYGLTYMETWAILPRVQAFMQSEAWRAKNFDNRDEDWHSRMARLVMQFWSDTKHPWKQAIRELPLIPLVSKEVKQSTINGRNADIHFPDVDGIPIPGDLDLPMILPAAAANPDCRKLYEALGVKRFGPNTGRETILSLYQDADAVAKLDVAKSRDHLVYLYRMEPKDFINKEEQEIMIIFDHKERIRHPRQEYVYLPGEGDWSPGTLLSPPFPEGVPEPDASLIHPLYLQDPPSPSEGMEKSWLEWLFQAVYCEEKIQLFTTRQPEAEAPKEYSPEYLYLIRTRPEKTLERLKINFQKPEVKKLWEEDKIGSALMRTMEFLCTDNVRRPLEKCLLPLPTLLTACRSSLVNVNGMPFLRIEGDMQEEDVPAWTSFANHFGVGAVGDVRFTLAMLGSISSTVTEITNATSRATIDLYLKLYAQWVAAHITVKAGLQRQIRSFFNENACILCSPVGLFGAAQPARWVRQSSCLWLAPDLMSTYTPLRSIWSPILQRVSEADREKLEDFFCKTLAIRHIAYQEVLVELGHLSRLTDLQKDHTLLVRLYLYKFLQETLRGAQDLVKIAVRQRFRETPLIYVPNHETKKWYKVSECVWSSDGANKDEICLEALYPELSELFVDFLDVPKMSAGLTYQALQDIGLEIHPVQDIKKLLWSLNESLLANQEASTVFADKIKSCRVFPVRMPDGSVQPLTALEEFCINDRPQYAEALKGKINFLDFTVEEVHRLKPTIEWLNLSFRCLSKAVTEKTSAEQSQRVVDRAFTDNISSKAAAFASIATHFSDGKATVRRHSLQENIRKVEVFRHADIKTSISCLHGFSTVTVPLERTALHFQATLGRWQIYLPEDDEDRDFCITTKLPRELTAHLLNCSPSEVDPVALIVTASVLQAKLNCVGRILESHGISASNDAPIETKSPPVTPKRQQSTNSGFGGASQPPARALVGSPVPALSPTQVLQSASSPYQALLIQAVNVARISTIPDKISAFDLSSISQSLQGTTARSGLFRFYVGDQTEWQRMVGAAGELFVFELLSLLPQALPGFSRDNWQSTVRHFVNVHPDYTSLDRWTGAEQGDLFFDDMAGTFTEYLIEKGYLEEGWRSERPEYYIEVKTTTSDRFETSFYMSKYQYARMQSYVNSSKTPHQRRKVYILFRVYGLESGQVGVRIYVNLEASRNNGELEFEAQSWTITPRAGV